MPQVAIVMGSESDRPTMQLAADILDSLGVSTEVVVMSAHRTPEKVREYARSAKERGIRLIIAGAGMAAHLPGVIAAWTTLPVLGVPGFDHGNDRPEYYDNTEVFRPRRN